mmetsp:Transcript_19389/g.21690  ORF Transcript_19389/g.21690 Transcript_19389/m.21690 type:complete len:83 (+) Transcript_19389:364-612(+)
MSPNGQRHSNDFSNTLNRALRYARLLTPSKYDDAVEKYVTPGRNVAGRVARRNDDYDDDDSDNSTSLKKCGKKEDVDKDYID